MVPHAAGMSKAGVQSGGGLDPQPLHVGRAPALRHVDGVERVEVQVDDPVDRLGDVSRPSGR
jgi:hypothetical protein